MTIQINDCPVCELEPAKREAVEEAIWGDKPWVKRNRRSGYRQKARIAAQGGVSSAQISMHSDHAEMAAAAEAMVLDAVAGKPMPDDLHDDYGEDVTGGFGRMNRRAASVGNRALRALDMRMAMTEAEDGGIAVGLTTKDLMEAAKLGIAAVHGEVRLLQTGRQNSNVEAFLAAIAEGLTGNLPPAPRDVTPAVDWRGEYEAERALLTSGE